MTVANFYRGRRVTVTGADGFIGSHLVEALMAAGAQVRALSYYNSFGTAGWLDHLPEATPDRLEIVAGDIRDPRLVESIVDGADTVFHLAALIGIPYSYVAPHSYVETNVSGTLYVLEAARRHGTRRVVHTSTSEVYGTARFTPISEQHPLQGQSPYSASKIGADFLAESYFRSFDVPTVILRPFNTFGPRQSERAVIPTVIRQALDPACQEIQIGDTRPVRDFNYVTNIAEAFMYAGAADEIKFGVPYNAGSGRSLTVGDMVDLVLAKTGCGKQLASKADRIRPEKSEVFELLADASLFSSATKWQPSVAFEEGLEKTIDWWRKEISVGRTRNQRGYQV